MIDLYCERTDLTFWSEPLNAVTNFAFILAAAVAFSLWRKHKTNFTRINNIVLPLMAANICVIGIGSFLFHTLATHWAMLADVIPIYIYKVLLLLLYPILVLKFSWFKSVGLFCLFLLATYLVGVMPIDLNGSQMYLPAISMLLLFAFLHKQQYQHLDKALLIACGAFLISITLRSIDNLICPHWPIGSHFGWHLCNGFVLFFTWKSVFNQAMNFPAKPDQHQP